MIAVRNMRLIGSQYVQRWSARYEAALAYAEARDRRRAPEPEIEWNGEMIGELRHRSADA